MTLLRRSSLVWAVAILVIGALRALGASVPGAKVEEALSEARKAFSQPGTSREDTARRFISRLVNDEPVAWADMVQRHDLHRVSPYQALNSFEFSAASQLDRDMEFLREDLAYIAQHEYKQLSLEERRQSLSALKVAFISQSEVVDPRDGRDVIPFQKQLNPDEMSSFAQHLNTRPATFGMWPLNVGDSHYLLAQLSTSPKIFGTVHGFEVTSKNPVLIGAWQEVGEHGSDIYQYLGVFQFPNPIRFRVFRQEKLAKIVKEIDRIRVWGEMTMYIKFVGARTPAQEASSGAAQLVPQSI